MQYRVLSAGLRQVHVCACGYRCDDVEVMAIHAVQQHAFPSGTALEVDYARTRVHAMAAAASCVMEADDPGGPWTMAVNGIPTKRYYKVAWKPEGG